MRKTLLIALLAAVSSSAFACDEMRELREAAARAGAAARASRLEAARTSIAEANVLKGIMERCLTLVYFPGMFDMSAAPVSIEAGAGDDYRAVSARLTFLRGAAGTTITLASKDRAAQFAALKADYASTLATAAAHLKAAGEEPGAMKWLWGLAEWGRQTQVKDGASEYTVLTAAQRDAVLAPAAASPETAERDPHE